MLPCTITLLTFKDWIWKKIEKNVPYKLFLNLRMHMLYKSTPKVATCSTCTCTYIYKLHLHLAYKVFCLVKNSTILQLNLHAWQKFGIIYSIHNGESTNITPMAKANTCIWIFNILRNLDRVQDGGDRR